MHQDSEPSADFPLGGSCEPFDIAREQEIDEE